MNWLQIHINTTSEGIEPLSDKLIAVGLDDFSTEDEQEFYDFLEDNRKYWDYVDEELVERMRGVSRVTVYVSDDDDRTDILDKLREACDEVREARDDIDFGSLDITYTVTDDADWATAWMQYYKPFKVGKRLYVKPEWETIDDDEGRVVFISNPGLAFGSGTHETTQLCLKALEETVQAGDSVLDMGCGSGILSVVAALLGAERVIGADIDKKAAEVSVNNAKLNHVEDKTSFFACDLTEDDSCARGGDGFDVIVINIVADVIIKLLPKAAELLKHDGILVLSGIIDSRLEDVLAAVKETGFEITRVEIESNWCAVTAKFPE